MRRCCTSAIPRWTMRLLAFYGAMLTRDATGAAVEDALDYSRQTLARLESSDQCRLAFGNGKTQVATAEDAYPDAGIRSCRAGHCSPCRCSMQKEAASPAFSTDGARGRAIIAKETRGCTNPLRVNCSLYFGAQHYKVDALGEWEGFSDMHVGLSCSRPRTLQGKRACVGESSKQQDQEGAPLNQKIL